jgi:ATP-dependent helicase HrpB
MLSGCRGRARCGRCSARWSFAAQRAALAPGGGAQGGAGDGDCRNLADLPDIRVVVDAGRARRARFDPNSGMSRLVTERVTKAEAEQRRGRAGRVAEGVCYRLWTKGEEGGLAPFPPAEIEVADLPGWRWNWRCGAGRTCRS